MAASQYPRARLPCGQKAGLSHPQLLTVCMNLQVILCLCLSFFYEEVMVLVSSGDNIKIILVLSFVQINKWIKI